MAKWSARHGLPDEWASLTLWKSAGDGSGVVLDVEAMAGRDRILGRTKSAPLPPAGRRASSCLEGIAMLNAAAPNSRWRRERR